MKKILFALLMSASLCACTSSGEPATVDDVEDAVEEVAGEAEASGNINAGAIEGMLGEPAKAVNEVSYTLDAVDFAEVNEANDAIPAEGNHFVYCTVTITNDSDADVEYSHGAWKLILPNGTEEFINDDASMGDDAELNEGTLAPGESVSGVLSYQAPTDGTLTLAVFGDQLLDEEPLVTWTIDQN